MGHLHAFLKITTIQHTRDFFHFENNDMDVFNLFLVVASCTNEAKERKSLLGQLSFIRSMWKIRGIKLH